MPNATVQWQMGSLIVNPAYATPGDKWFVDSVNGAAGSSAKSWEAAITTIDAAINLAGNGDTIFVSPTHVENLAADSAVDIDVAGVHVVGLRIGRHMPTLTATAVAGDLKLAANNVSLQNIRFVGGIDATTGVIEVTGTDCALLDCEYRDSTGQATTVISVVNNADRFLINGWRSFGAAAAGAESSIQVNGGDDIEIKNFYVYGNFSVGGINFLTTASARVNVHDGKIWTENAADIGIIDTITGSTGFIGPNLGIRLQDDAANITEAVTGATFHVIDDVYVVNADNQKAVRIDWTASA